MSSFFGFSKPLPANVAALAARTHGNLDTTKGFEINKLDGMLKEGKITAQQMGVFTIMINNSTNRKELRTIITSIYNSIDNPPRGGRRSRRRMQRRY